MTKMKLIAATIITAALVTTSFSSLAKGKEDERSTGRGTGGTILVLSNGLFYDTMGLSQLPFNGTTNFQQLYVGMGPSGAATDAGPGDSGYYGGRWWVDVNGNGEMDENDNYFLCPLLGPGKSAP